MSSTLQHEIGTIAVDRARVDRENPGFSWDDANDGGRKLPHAEAQERVRFEQQQRCSLARLLLNSRAICLWERLRERYGNESHRPANCD